jgi:hypothetical protein
MKRSTETVTNQVYNRSENVRTLIRTGQTDGGILIPSKYDDYFGTGNVPANRLEAKAKKAAATAEASRSNPTEASKGTLKRNVGRVAVAALATGAGIFGIGKALTSVPSGVTSGTAHETGIATLTKTAGSGEYADNGVYQVAIGQGGSVYDGLKALAKAEGKNPTSLPVSEALNSESRNINGLIEEGKVSAQSNGVVSPGVTEFSVLPDSKIVDPEALKAAAPQEVITKEVS